MRGRLLILPPLLIACSGTRIPSSSVASTSEPTGTITGPPTRTTVGTPATSWAAGTPAAATTAILTPNEPVALRVPAAVAAQVTGPTLLFYFSPTCPHCESVMPEINQLRTQLPDLTFVGIPTGSATPVQIAHFVATHGADFEMVHDTDRGFSQAVGARSTPTVYIARPPHPDEEPANRAFISTGGDITLLEAYAPFGRGMGAILALRMHPEDPFRDFARGYQGDRVCSTCHQQEALSWAMTHHSVAYRTLHSRGRAEDPACVGCHVTGLGQPGGFVAGDHGSPLRDVTCESCHGPAGPHDGKREDATASCGRCHDAEHSIHFDISKGIQLIDHYQANHTSEPEIRARIQALAKGEAEKPLLAFPAGPTSGARACADCHEAQHGWGTKDPHASAMDSLAGSDADDPTCVRCHATPIAVDERGLPADPSIEGFRVEEGVSCESCHGPAAAHVAAPSKSNIVGLGDACPECVIEAICTSCHVPRWDPDWELDQRLSAIAH